jgi:hypothetical protein
MVLQCRFHTWHARLSPGNTASHRGKRASIPRARRSSGKPLRTKAREGHLSMPPVRVSLGRHELAAARTHEAGSRFHRVQIDAVGAGWTSHGTPGRHSLRVATADKDVARRSRPRRTCRRSESASTSTACFISESGSLPWIGQRCRITRPCPPRLRFPSAVLRQEDRSNHSRRDTSQNPAIV